MARKRWPSIFVDEHVSPVVKAAFTGGGFRTVEVARDSRYAGRDEKDYIEEMYAANEVFVTGDAEFVEYVLDKRPRHACVVMCRRA
jgi:hypothetical protein